MTLNEFKQSYLLGYLDKAIVTPCPKEHGFYLMITSNQWGVNSFLETSRSLKPRRFVTPQAVINAAKSIGFQSRSIVYTK